MSPAHADALPRRASLLTLSLVLAACSCAATIGAAEIGARVDAFTLPDIHGRDRSLNEFADQQFVVVAFLGTECPLARLYAPRLQELSEEYAKRGVAFVSIDANHQDSLADMTAFAGRYGVKFPLLKDRDQAVADKFGAARNPEVFVLDRERTIRYRDRIDDQYGLGASSGYARAEINRRDLGVALDELLAGGKVSQPTTQPLGCLIGRKPKVEPHGDVTYTKHIAPLLENRCVSCHRPGEVGPFALNDYDEVVGWAGMMREVVSNGRMPPWSANPEVGHFANDARLSDAEKQLIYSWVDNGCPQGDPADLAAPRQWTDGWRIREPDQVVRMPQPFKVPAEGVVSYQHIVIDPGWKEDKWVQAAEARPGNRAVVHHIIVFVMPAGGLGGGRGGADAAADAEADQPARPRGPRAQGGGRGGAGGLLGQGGGGLTAYVPGNAPSVYEPGVAVFVPKGSKVVFQMHYTPNGTAQEDQSYLGVVFADPQTVKKRVHGGAAMNRGFAIPPQTDNYEAKSSYKFQNDQLLVSMSPHMHLRGKSFRFEAQYPDGSQEVLLDVPKYDFNWQFRYELSEPKRMPAGTIMNCTARFDNSENNLANPNPNETVRWGPQTWHEMMIGFFTTIAVDDDAHPLDRQQAASGTGE
jgi:peroxiredoxin